MEQVPDGPENVETSAVIMGGLALSRVGHDRYLRFVLPFVGIALAIGLAFVIIGAALA